MAIYQLDQLDGIELLPGRAFTRAVMTEQMAYLMVHEEQCSIPECPDCQRLQIIRIALFKPFRTIRYAWADDPKAKAA